MLSTSGSLDGNAAASCVAQRRVRRHRVVQPTQICIPIHGLVQRPEVITHSRGQDQKHRGSTQRPTDGASNALHQKTVNVRREPGWGRAYVALAS